MGESALGTERPVIRELVGHTNARSLVGCSSRLLPISSTGDPQLPDGGICALGYFHDRTQQLQKQKQRGHSNLGLRTSSVIVCLALVAHGEHRHGVIALYLEHDDIAAEPNGTTSSLRNELPPTALRQLKGNSSSSSIARWIAKKDLCSIEFRSNHSEHLLGRMMGTVHPASSREASPRAINSIFVLRKSIWRRTALSRKAESGSPSSSMLSPAARSSGSKRSDGRDAVFMGPHALQLRCNLSVFFDVLKSTQIWDADSRETPWCCASPGETHAYRRSTRLSRPAILIRWRCLQRTAPSAIALSTAMIWKLFKASRRCFDVGISANQRLHPSDDADGTASIAVKLVAGFRYGVESFELILVFEPIDLSITPEPESFCLFCLIITIQKIVDSFADERRETFSLFAILSSAFNSDSTISTRMRTLRTQSLYETDPPPGDESGNPYRRRNHGCNAQARCNGHSGNRLAPAVPGMHDDGIGNADCQQSDLCQKC
jgi:hypothetical protein